MSTPNQPVKFPKYTKPILSTPVTDNLNKIIYESEVYLKPLVGLNISTQDYMLLCKENGIDPLQTLVDDTDAEITFAGIKIRSRIVFAS